MAQGYGEMLKKAREEKDMEYEEVCKILKIDPVYLKALEEERMEDFEKPVYMRMFLRTYARFLKVDIDKVISFFEQTHGIKTAEKELKKSAQEGIVKEEIMTEAESAREKNFKLKNKRNIVITAAGAVAVLLAVVLFFVFKGRGGVVDGNKEIYVVPRQANLKVIAKARDEVWMKAKYDGGEEAFFLKKGEDKKWENIQRIVFLIGNAGGVEFIVNGDSIGAIGEEGEVINGLVFQVGKNWYIDRGQGFKIPKRPVPQEEPAVKGNTLNPESGTLGPE